MNDCRFGSHEVTSMDSHEVATGCSHGRQPMERVHVVRRKSRRDDRRFHARDSCRPFGALRSRLPPHPRAHAPWLQQAVPSGLTNSHEVATGSSHGRQPMERVHIVRRKSRRDDRRFHDGDSCRPFRALQSCLHPHPRALARGYIVPSLRDSPTATK